MMDISGMTIKRVRDGLKKKQFSAVELVEAYLDHIKKHDNDIHAYLTVTEELALSQAQKLDKRIAAGEAIGNLAGVPIAIKDVILVDSVRATGGSKMLENYVAPYDATVVKKLKKADAIIIGKTNLDEFAAGSSTENSAFGPTKNPHDLERVPGGSSGGSTAAVAADECVCALGSETGGSVRQPSAFCGVVGLKPTYGRVSRYGLMAMVSSVDQIGPIAKNVEDVAQLLEAIEGYDEMDSTSVDLRRAGESASVDIKQLKIGVPKEYFGEGLDEDIKKTVESAIKKYEQKGAKIIEVSLPHIQYGITCYYIVQPAEFSTNLARYDGIKYGHSEKSNDLTEGYLKTRQYGFGEEIKRRIMLGTYVLSAGFYDAYYSKASKVRTLIRDDFIKTFNKVDVIMGPTTPTLPFKIGEKSDDPVAMYLSDLYTAPINLAGLPAVSIPCGKVGNLPVGLHIIGPHFQDKKILQVASLFK